MAYLNGELQVEIKKGGLYKIPSHATRKMIATNRYQFSSKHFRVHKEAVPRYIDDSIFRKILR